MSIKNISIMINNIKKEKLLEIIMPFQPKRIGIFGSYARNEQTNESDLDVLVSFTKTINLLDLVGVELDLCEQLDMKVDLLTENAVNNAIRPYIEKDIKWIWG